MKQTRIRFNLDGLDHIKKAVGNTYVARVGVLGGRNDRTDGGEFGNAEIGLIQEFGSNSRNIPARSWLRMPIEAKNKDIVDSMTSSMAKSAFAAGNYKKLFQYLGIAGVIAIQEAFASRGFGRWAPNAPETIAAKGSSAPLIDTAQLRRSVTNDVVKKGQY
jgi:hypothetical protein